MFFYESDGYYYPTTAGTVLLIVIAFVALFLAAFLTNRNNKKKLLNTKQLVCCALCIALAFVTSYIRFFPMPYGGSVTLLSMFFICYIGYCFGLRAGISCAFAYSILQFMQEPYILSPFQVCCDYFLAFTALGLSGLFRKYKYGLITGYIVGALGRGIFHIIGGYIYWMDYMPDNFPKAITVLYPIVYNMSYIGAEMVITIIVLLVPSMRKVLETIKKQANY